MGQILSFLPIGGSSENNNKLPVLDVNYPQDVTVMEGLNVNASFNIVISEPGMPAEYTYQWYFNGEAINDTNSSSFSINQEITKGTYNVYCEVTNEAGTITSKISKLIVESYLPKFDYDGSCQVIEDGNYNWRIKFLTSGILTFTKNPGTVDIFLVGGGGGGTRYYGLGGGGGKTETFFSVPLAENIPYEIIIGAGGSKGDSSGNVASAGGNTIFATSRVANGGEGSTKGGSGKGGSGGSGGSGSTSGRGGVDGANGTGGNNPGKGQGTTTRAFGEADGELYSTGGNGNKNTTGKNGQPNTGDGGCGGDGNTQNYSGGSGIAIIRNSRIV